MKKLLIWMFLGLGLFAPLAFACDHKGGAKGECARESGCSGSGESEHSCPIIGKFFKKAHFFLANGKEIGFSEEQIAEIKTLKSDMTKASIRQEAEMKIAMMDMTEKLSAPELDVDGLNAMVDQGIAGMAQGAKGAIASYAKLKAIPTPEQMAKAKEIWQRDSQ